MRCEPRLSQHLSFSFFLCLTHTQPHNFIDIYWHSKKAIKRNARYKYLFMLTIFVEKKKKPIVFFFPTFWIRLNRHQNQMMPQYNFRNYQEKLNFFFPLLCSCSWSKRKNSVELPAACSYKQKKRRRQLHFILWWFLFFSVIINLISDFL